MRQDERDPFVLALRRARDAAYAPGEYVGQESFMRATDIRALARAARIRQGVTVLDVCCGVAGPGRFLTRELGCDYLGVDSSESAIAIARDRAGDLPCRFEVAHVPPLPAGTFDVVLLLETLLAFEHKAPLLAGVAGALRPRGRFVCTLEEGAPLSPSEQEAMPDADTVWLTPRGAFLELLWDAGLTVRWEEDQTASHRAMAEALHDAFLADREAIAEGVGEVALDELLAAHRLWVDWLGSGRVRKLAFVTERVAR